MQSSENNSHPTCRYLAQNPGIQQVSQWCGFLVAEDSVGEGRMMDRWYFDHLNTLNLYLNFQILAISHFISHAKQSPLSTAGYAQADRKWQSLGLSQNDPQWWPLWGHYPFYFVGSHNLSGHTGFSDSERDMIIKPRVRPWAILPGSKLVVNQTACLKEIWGKLNHIASYQKPNNNFAQLITNQKWQIVAP